MTTSGTPPVAGDVAIDVTRELTEPVRALRDRLGGVVDQLERHLASSTGPTPYPWRSVQALRQELAAAYLDATTLARRLDELDRALDDDPPAPFDLAAAVDLGLRLASQHLGAGLELVSDLGITAPVRGTPGGLALVVAQLVGACARSARAVPGATLTVRVVAEGAGWGVVLIADNGAGTDQASALRERAASVLGPWGAAVDAASEPGQGCAFELRLAVAAPSITSG